MAAIYNYQTADTISSGLQGCKVCDEAIQAARRIAAERGETVVLEDDVISGYAPGVEVGGGLGGNGTVFLSNNTITNNSTGVAVGTGTAFTRSNNTIVANTTNVSGSLTPFAGR